MTELIVAGRGGVPVDASAVVLNVTVAGAAGAGFVSAYPCGSPRPDASNLNYTAGATVANAVVARVGDDGKVCIFTSNIVQLITDVSGYFPANDTYTALTPARLLDSRRSLDLVTPTLRGCGAFTSITETDPVAMQIGTSIEGRPISAEFYGDPSGTPVLIVGPVHGNECTPLIIVERLRTEARSGSIPPGIRLVIIPTMNPDGLARGSRRNAKDVDLNRDGASQHEPETQALMDFTEWLQPAASIHLHSPLKFVGGQGGPSAEGVRMAAVLAGRTGMVLLPEAGRDSYFLWSGQTKRVPSMATVLIETPRDNAFDASQATGFINPGPAASDRLWNDLTRAILDSLTIARD